MVIISHIRTPPPNHFDIWWVKILHRPFIQWLFMLRCSKVAPKVHFILCLDPAYASNAMFSFPFQRVSNFILDLYETLWVKIWILITICIYSSGLVVGSGLLLTTSPKIPRHVRMAEVWGLWMEFRGSSKLLVNGDPLFLSYHISFFQFDSIQFSTFRNHFKFEKQQQNYII